ncbi:MAG: replication initiation factor domain-containing protein [Magnetococcales bacterium]|nr:replication initiation factor domain-containing protein [Magnetococcales bacterium]
MFFLDFLKELQFKPWKQLSEEELVERLVSKSFGLSVEQSVEQRDGWYDYKGIIVTPSGEDVGRYEYGGNNNTICLTLRGKAFTQLEVNHEGQAKAINRLHHNLRRLDARITRIDLALDDYQGTHSVDKIVDAYSAGEFDIKGQRQVNKNTVSNGSGGGHSFNIGTNKNQKMLIAYERGKKLDLRGSNWVRLELRLRSRKNSIPLATMCNPGPVFKDAYPFTKKLDINNGDNNLDLHVTHHRKAEEADLKSYLKALQSSYGKLFNYLFSTGVSPDTIIHSLRRDGIPTRLNKWMGKNQLSKEQVEDTLLRFKKDIQ